MFVYIHYASVYTVEMYTHTSVHFYHGLLKYLNLNLNGVVVIDT